jgi:hypothetical protein
MATPAKFNSRLHKKKSGHYTLSTALKIVSENARKLDDESWLSTLGDAGAALREFRTGIVADLGGEENISNMEKAIIEMIVRAHLLVSSIDRYILALPCPVNRQRHTLYPVVAQRDQLANSLCRNLERLGLKRRPKPLPSLAEIMSGPPQIGDAEASR